MTHEPQRVSEGERGPGANNPSDNAKHGAEQEPSQRRGTPTTLLAPLPKPSAVDADRRRLLQWLGVGAAAATMVAPRAVEAKSRPHPTSGVLVFRLTTRRHHACHACRRHHRFTVFRTHALADAHRAHPGCNCPIVRQRLRRHDFLRLFGPRGVAPSGVADVRKTPLHR